MKNIKINTSDNYSITAHHFKPKTSNGKIILINSATAIKQQFYFKYATYLIHRGYDVITYDYRGIGMSRNRSLKGFNATMRDWASKDFTAVTSYINQHFSTYKKVLIGHSFGGNSIGLSNKANDFDAYISVASQFGYWKNFNKGYRPLLLWLFYFAMPLITFLFGYFPSRVKQLGENLPKGVARDWITLITHPESMLKLTETKGNYFETIDKPFLMLSFSDDQMAPKKAVDVLASKVYKNALVERLHIRATKESPIGHLNFFKKRFEKELWEIPNNWLSKLQLS